MSIELHPCRGGQRGAPGVVRPGDVARGRGQVPVAAVVGAAVELDLVRIEMILYRDSLSGAFQVRKNLFQLFLSCSVLRCLGPSKLCFAHHFMRRCNN